MPPAKYIKPVKGKKTPPAKKEKLVKLDEMGGEAWGTYLYRPYVSRQTDIISSNLSHQTVFIVFANFVSAFSPFPGKHKADKDKYPRLPLPFRPILPIFPF